jgi:hypothetical protein
VVVTFVQFANDAQEAFSTHKHPTLAYVIPALEQLYKHWKCRRNKIAYIRYHAALDATLNTVDEYYARTEDSDAFIMAMGMYSCFIIWLGNFLSVL